MMTVKLLTSLYREQLPTLLRKKDRGRPTGASGKLEPKRDGGVKAVIFISSTEVLLKVSKKSEKDDSDGYGDQTILIRELM
jgi:hypothetical protein